MSDQEINVGGLKFTFPLSWQISKYDDWAFYRNQFAKVHSGIKAVDLIAIDDEQTVWLIEVKDYRQHRRQKTMSLWEEVSHKILDTLAAMLPTKVNSSSRVEQNFAQKVLSGKKVRVILHLEQPRMPSKLWPRAFNPSNVQLKLRTQLKAIDPHPKVVESTKMQALAWTVS